MPKRTTYSAEFKREAVRLLEEADKPAAEIAIDLGIRRNQLYKWKEQLDKSGENAFKGSGRPRKGQKSEVSRLKRELAEVKEERDILKKAAAYFASQSM